MKTSIVICTFNRQDQVEKCLNSIWRHGAAEFAEIIVVDNCPTQSCCEVISKYKELGHDIKYIQLDEPSLSLARNLGLENSCTKYVTYIDDDSLVTREWCERMKVLLNRDYDVFGGPYGFHSESIVPEWYPVETLVFGLDIETGFLQNGIFLSGTNMTFRHSLLVQLEGFKKEFGMSGENQGYGEETELQIRAQKKGIKIFFDRQMLLTHLAADYKLDFWWLMRAYYLNGRDHPVERGTYRFFILFLKFGVSLFWTPIDFVIRYFLNRQSFKGATIVSTRRAIFFWGCLRSLL